MRFPEFTEPWERDRIRNLFNINVGGDIDKKNVSPTLTDEYKYPIIANALSNHGIYGYTFTFKDSAPCITVTGRGEVGVAKFRDYPLYPIVRLLVLHSNGIIDCQFGEHAINAIKKYEESTGVPQLTAPQLGAYSIKYPSFDEQVKIGKFFASLDRRIAVQSKLIEDLKKVKIFLMEKLFCLPKERTPKLRLYKVADDWQRIKLSDVVERVTIRNRANSCTRVLTIAAQHGLIDQQDFFNKRIASSNLSTYYLLHRGDFAYNKSYSSEYPWGAVKRLDDYDDGVLSSLYICFRPNKKVDSDYLRHYFESTKWYRGISEISGEGARNHGLLNMSVEDFFDTEHRIPSIDEQRKIAHFFNILFKKLHAEEMILSQYQNQKNYLLNNMFI